MSLAIVYSRAQAGVQAPLVTVEVHLTGGLPGMSIVGLPETAVKESKDRVRSALINGRFEFPVRRITVNLAPADLPKDGGRFDLPIALGILAASAQLPRPILQDYEFLGELALSGELRPIRGVLPAAIQARDSGRALVVPDAIAGEATLARGGTVYAAGHLLEVFGHLSGASPIAPCPPARPPANGACPADLREVRGQHQAKRALEVAAAGAHNLLLVGPPGTGKTMLASRLPGILPPMSEAEAVETAMVHSISNRGFDLRQWARRPFRAPHHTASGVALVGGGSVPRPGEVSLAHNGVLFLDELPEFDRRVLEVLREPMESGSIVISRAARQEEFPARFQLVAAMNPCPGGATPGGREDDCTPDESRRYMGRISAPLLDRFDLRVQVPRVPGAELYGAGLAVENSDSVRARVSAARARQLQRWEKPNAHASARDVETHCVLGGAERELLLSAMERLHLSTRAWHRVLKVARTIADLAAAAGIEAEHLMEALSYRRLE